MSNFLEDLEAQLDAAARARAEGRLPGARRRSRGLGGAVGLLLAAAVTAAVAALVISIGHGRSGSATAGGADVHRCDPADLKLSSGPQVVPQTGEEAVLLVLTNRSGRSCIVDGYPRVSLIGQRGRLPFVYAQGGGTYVTKRSPRRVRLDSGARAYFLVAKYRCDGGVQDTARSIRVALTGQQSRFALRLGRAGAGGLDYCRRYPGDERVDPGNRVAVSPIEASQQAAFPFEAIPLLPCRASQLKIKTIHSYAGLAHSGAYIAFTNQSPVRCELTGWPKLVAITAAGKATRATDGPASSFTVTTRGIGIPVVKLAPGERADASFVAADDPGPGMKKCPPSYRWLRVTPPGNSTSVVLSAWVRYLDAYLPACGGVGVSPVMPRSDLYGG